MSEATATQDLALLDAFLNRWHDADGSERANYQLFVADLCALLDLPTPQPHADQNAERRGREHHTLLSSAVARRSMSPSRRLSAASRVRAWTSRTSPSPSRRSVVTVPGVRVMEWA